MDRIDITNNDYLKELHDFGISNDIPIIQDEGLDKLLELVNTIKPKKILELGTAIGYSSSVLALNSLALIDTVERNQKMYDLALNNINKAKLNNRIRIFYCDALELDLSNLYNDYDLIFIDAAKAQYKRFFLKYSEVLKTNGYIFTDNLSFHGLVPKYHDGSLTGVSKDLRALVRKIDNYNNWLKNYEAFDTTFYSIGDGIAISRKK